MSAIHTQLISIFICQFIILCVHHFITLSDNPSLT